MRKRRLNQRRGTGTTADMGGGPGSVVEVELLRVHQRPEQRPPGRPGGWRDPRRGNGSRRRPPRPAGRARRRAGRVRRRSPGPCVPSAIRRLDDLAAADAVVDRVAVHEVEGLREVRDRSSPRSRRRTRASSGRRSSGSSSLTAPSAICTARAPSGSPWNLFGVSVIWEMASRSTSARTRRT